MALAAAPLAGARPKQIPVGLEMYSVRAALQKDLTGTVTAVAKMGYQVVEFYAPYYQWSAQQAKEVRSLMDGLGVQCRSTHNDAQNFGAGRLPKAIELNQILGARYIVMATANASTPDAWKGVAATLTSAASDVKPHGLRVGYHNHQAEFTKPADGGPLPMQVLAANTPKDVMLQLDVGTCVQMGYDPVRWIRENPGRIRVLHLKDWGAGSGPDRGYRTLFGEGDCPWSKIFAAAESAGGAEYYLIEQEGSRYPELETAERCLAAYKKLRASA